MTVADWYFPTWLPMPQAGLVFGLLTGCLILSYVWQRRVSPLSATKIGRLRQVLPAVPIVIGPAMVLVGVGWMFFPFSQPATLVLRSQALPIGAQAPNPRCFDDYFKQLTAGSMSSSTCPAVNFTQTGHILDATPLARRAISLFEANSAAPVTDRDVKTDAKLVDLMRNTVIKVLTDVTPREIIDEPPPPSSSPRLPAWVVESMETAIVEGLTTLHNVRDISVERYVTKEAPADNPWTALQTRLSADVEITPPIFQSSDGNILTSGSYFRFFGCLMAPDDERRHDDLCHTAPRRSTR